MTALENQPGDAEPQRAMEIFNRMWCSRGNIDRKPAKILLSLYNSKKSNMVLEAVKGR